MDKALAYAAAHPIALLDEAMRGHHGTHIDFEHDSGDLLDPPCQFARLLHQAFGLHFPAGCFDHESEHWQRVIDAFADRYQLWR